MIFDGERTQQITAADIRFPVQERTQEDQFLEFKRDPYPVTDGGKRKMIKDVSAFANAAGGYIVIGVSEDGEGRASEGVGVADGSGEPNPAVMR